jgi:hypothetical protein
MLLLPALAGLAIAAAAGATPILDAPTDALAGFGVRLAIDVLGVTALVRGAHRGRDRRGDLLIACYGLSLAVLLAARSLAGPALTIADALGLLAAVTLARVVYAVLRYRGERLVARDAGCLLLVGALGLVTAIADGVGLGLALLGAVAIACALGLAGKGIRARDGAPRIAAVGEEEGATIPLRVHGAGRSARKSAGNDSSVANGAAGPSYRAAAAPRERLRRG